jgi:hypothetical protein
MGLAVGSTGRSSALSLQGAVGLLGLCAVGAWVFAFWFASHLNATRDFTFAVTAVVEGPDAAHPYAVEVGDDHRTFSFRRPPGLDVGERFDARYDLAGQYVGWSAYGRYTAAQDQPSKVVFFLPIAVAVCLTWVAVYIARGERLPRGEGP